MIFTTSGVYLIYSFIYIYKIERMRMLIEHKKGKKMQVGVIKARYIF